jgi:hypothetical protein
MILRRSSSSTSISSGSNPIARIGSSSSNAGGRESARVSPWDAEQTIDVWRHRFGRLEATDVKRLRQLEHENGRLKKLVAERDLEIEVMKEVARKDG